MLEFFLCLLPQVNLGHGSLSHTVMKMEPEFLSQWVTWGRLFEWYAWRMLEMSIWNLLLCIRNGISVIKSKLQSVWGILIPFLTSSDGTMRPSKWFLVYFFWFSNKYLNMSKPSTYRNFKFGDVNVLGAERIAKICMEEGVPRLIHISHLNASTSSPSQFYQTKAEGEQRVKTAFPNATIFRPGAMYGYEDRLLNNIASECCLATMFS